MTRKLSSKRLCFTCHDSNKKHYVSLVCTCIQTNVFVYFDDLKTHKLCTPVCLLSLIVHYTSVLAVVCALLLVPPALEYGWLADTRTRRVRPALNHLADELRKIGGVLWANAQRAMEHWRQRIQERQRIRRQNRNNT